MKTIAPALLAAIESGTVATLIKVTLTDGTIYGYTDHDAPLTVEGQLYEPVAGQSVLKMNLTSDASVSSQDLAAAWTPIISEQAVLEGRYDFAQVEYFLCSWGSDSLGSVPIFGGRIGKITYIDKGFSAQAFSNMWNLSQYIGIEFTANCRHKFGATQDPQGVAGCFYDVSGTDLLDNGQAGGASPPTSNTSGLLPPTGLTAILQNYGGTLAAGNYDYTVTTLSSTGESLQSSILATTTASAQSGFMLAWNPVIGATGYRVYRNGTLIGATTNQVYQGAIVGTIINAVEFYVGINSAYPGVPNSPNAPQLSATPVFASTTGGIQYLPPTEGPPYSYSVSSIVDGIESPSSPISSIYTTLTIQGLPTFWQSFFSVQLPGNSIGSTITLNWNAVPNATAYNVYGRFNQALLATVAPAVAGNAPPTTWTDNGSGSGGTINPPYGDFFSQGFLTMTSGAANGLSREVKFCHSGKLQLWLPLERPVTVGDTFNISVGCVKTTTACTYKFKNLVNFGGFPGIKPEVLYTSPHTSTGSSAKK